jgi:hypothetical protein
MRHLNLARSSILGLAGPAAFLCLTVSSAVSPIRAQESGAQSRPFTGYIEIRQKGGTQSYAIHVTRGKVTSGIGFHKGTEEANCDIVGGWYDRHRLMLLIQSRSPDIQDPWAAHAHQFVRTGQGFLLEHTLYGYGKTAENGKVYRPHVIERIVEVKDGPSHAGSLDGPRPD